MSKKTTGTDLGYRAYFAAFAVMLLIIAAAVCILSGCLDKYIFTAEVPMVGTGTADDTNAVAPSESDTGELISPAETDEETSPADTDGASEEQSTDSESTEQSKDSEKSTEPAETTKEAPTTEETTTAKPEDTTQAPETTKTPETTETPDTTNSAPEDTEEAETTQDPDFRRDEIISRQDNNLMVSYGDNSMTVIGYDGHPTKIEVSRKIDGIDVTAIGADAFAGNGILKSVRISAGVRSIGSGAMRNCGILSEVYIPTTVKNIASDAFANSSKVVIHGKRGSYAEAYAKEHGIEFKVD